MQKQFLCVKMAKKKKKKQAKKKKTKKKKRGGVTYNFSSYP